MSLLQGPFTVVVEMWNDNPLRDEQIDTVALTINITDLFKTHTADLITSKVRYVNNDITLYNQTTLKLASICI